MNPGSFGGRARDAFVVFRRGGWGYGLRIQCTHWLRNDTGSCMGCGEAGDRKGRPYEGECPPLKCLTEFAARRRQKIGIIFHRDMCVGKNTSQAASVEFCRLQQNYARGRLGAF